MENSEYTNYEENPIDIKDVSTIRIKPGKKRREIKDLASDLVYGGVPNGEGTGLEGIKTLSIKSYPKYDNREHRILHRAYNRYKAKKEQQEQEQEFELAPLSVVNTWDKDKQTKWFTAQMNRGARTVLPPLLSVMFLPSMIESVAASPLIFTTGMLGGLGGSYVGGQIGRKIDERRHGLSDAEIIGNLIGGAVGGIGGTYGGHGLGVSAIKQGWMPRNAYKWNLATKGMIDDAAAEMFDSGIKSAYKNPKFKENLTNWSNRRWLKQQLYSDNLNPQYIHETSNDGFVNNTKHSYFTKEGLHPGNRKLHNFHSNENVDLIWLNKQKMFADEGEDLIVAGNNLTSFYQPFTSSLDTSPIAKTTLAVDWSVPTRKTILNTYSPAVVATPDVIPYSKIKARFTYDPLTKTFSKFHFLNPADNRPAPKGSFTLYERPLTSFKTAEYVGAPETYNGKTVPVWQLPKGQRNQAVYVRSPEQQFVTSYLEKSSIPREHKFHIGDFSIFDPTEAVSKDMSTFIKTLPEPNPKFLVDKNIIDGYRNYLNHLDISSSNISDLDLQKLLSYQYQTLSNSATGKLKNTLVFHSSPKWFDNFDLRHTGKHMNNSGVMGPGNYFSREGTVYGHTSDAFGRSTMNNTQPYIITEITSTPNGRIMQSKGVLPEMIDGYLFRDKITNVGTHINPNFDIKLQQQIAATPINDTRAYIIPSTARGFKELYNLGDYNVGELMIRRNTGIKSLYPHPSRFIKNADGTVTLKPVDWSDIRVNYKEGGKLK